MITALILIAAVAAFAAALAYRYMALRYLPKPGSASAEERA